MTEKTTLGAILRNIRHQHGMSQAQLADLAGCTRITVHNIEHDKANPRFSTLVNVFGAMGYTMNIHLADEYGCTYVEELDNVTQTE